MSKIRLLNTEVDNFTMSEAIDEAEKLILERKNSYIVTPNVDHILRLEDDEEFREIYEKASMRLTDGKPLIWIANYFKNPIKEKISGSDFFPRLCERASKKGYSVFLLGAAEGVADMAAENLKKKYPGLKIAGTYSPSFGFENKPDEIEKIMKMLNDVKPDILAVGLGSPKQEKFIYKYRDKMNVPLSLAIGASIDFEAGNKKRAPRFMSEAGFEWLYRLCKEPRRMFMRNLTSLRIIKVIRKYKKINK